MHIQKNGMTLQKHCPCEELGRPYKVGLQPTPTPVEKKQKLPDKVPQGLRTSKGPNVQKLKGKNDKEPVTLDLVSVQGII